MKSKKHQICVKLGSNLRDHHGLFNTRVVLTYTMQSSKSMSAFGDADLSTSEDGKFLPTSI